MKELTLYRFFMGAEVTLGYIEEGRNSPTWTLERPWKDNAKNISCIPEGRYSCTNYVSQRFARAFELHNVPGREAILIHAGNEVSDTQGCIMPGMTIGLNTKGIPTVMQSAVALGNLMASYRQGFILNIKNMVR